MTKLISPYELVDIQWVDAHNNQGAWVYGTDGVEEFAKDVRFNVAQVGWLVFEDGECVVIASRVSKSADPDEMAFGQLERIPKGVIKYRSDND
jgi:hypothetical protein